MGMAGYFVHNSEAIFKNPKDFDPDRWLGEDAASLEKWLVSFGKGPRMCMGQKCVHPYAPIFPNDLPLTGDSVLRTASSI